MKNLIKKQKQLFSIVIFFTITGVLVYFAVIPLFNAVQKTQNEIQEEIVNQEIRSKHLQELPKIKQQYEFLESKNNLANTLLNKDEAVLLIQKLEKLADQTGNTISIKIPEQAKATTTKSNAKNKVDSSLVDGLPSKNYLQMDVQLSGKYEQIINFMAKMETADYYGDIISIQLSKDDNAVVSKREESDVFSSTSTSGNIKNATGLTESSEKIGASISVVFYLQK